MCFDCGVVPWRVMHASANQRIFPLACTMFPCRKRKRDLDEDGSEKICNNQYSADFLAMSEIAAIVEKLDV